MHVQPIRAHVTAGLYLGSVAEVLRFLRSRRFWSFRVLGVLALGWPAAVGQIVFQEAHMPCLRNAYKLDQGSYTGRPTALPGSGTQVGRLPLSTPLSQEGKA